ncbi:peptidylprolyl isomerase [Capnocytophaga sp. oral taxon 878]|uniref:peptidylprolyl isomerase n=1 Tax=Capnocytophaga sp. oral taxon 878 TaxID=1316596 RepID=UPI000D033D00|nr:peptidylprolyl isomerase [Capnocytophaga sp. oral taxon 878]AVM49791.1 peptidylprolyl isomerase [Capnocytophaga sp. oral taxon 878]
MKHLLIISLLFIIACNNSNKQESTQKTTATITTTTVVDTAKTVQKDTVLDTDIPGERLTTDTAIPFLFEYEKRHKERFVRIITEYGNIDIELFKETPYHRANFIFLAKQHYFDGTIFHRVVKDFVIQGGNSDTWEVSKRRGRIGTYLLPPDTKKGFKHHRGIVSMPSSDIDNPYQFASPYEFFIVVQKPGAYHLDGGYTAFGKVIAGMEVADKINQVETEGKDDWPKKDIKMKVVILDK